MHPQSAPRSGLRFNPRGAPPVSPRRGAVQSIQKRKAMSSVSGPGYTVFLFQVQVCPREETDRKTTVRVERAGTKAGNGLLRWLAKRPK